MVRFLVTSALVLLFASCHAAQQTAGPGAAGAPSLADRLAKFAPVEIRADLTALPDSERQALTHMIEAAKLLIPIFQRQAWHGNPDLAEQLSGEAAELFGIHVGAWDRLDSQPFVGNLPRPDGAGYYPADLTKAEFMAYVAAHPDQKENLEGLFTMVVRNGDRLRAVPYSEYFAEWLLPAAAHLRAAADLTRNESLQRYLRSRADAFLSDDYYQSDMDWMDLDSEVEITIGPYEVYEDRMFGFKAAFEAFVTVVDRAESERLALYKSELPAMEQNLPIPDHMKNPDRGSESPIRVVDEVFTAGDTRAGVQTIAFNLPNDERVRTAKGSKKVLLRNVIKAKYEGILKPIAAAMLVPEQVALVSGDSFTNHTLFHEMAHGLGPGQIVKDGRKTEVRLELKELYSGIEEAKADIMGVYNQLFMVEKGLMPASIKRNLFPTWLAGLFRSIRFGIEEAHGKANMIQFNYMLKRGAVVRDAATGRYRVQFDEFEKATTDLVREICLLQAKGDYRGTLAFFEKYADMGEQLRHDLERLADIPVDIRPVYDAN